MTRAPLFLALAMALASPARAQPVTQPAQTTPLAELRDDKQLADALAQITQDPAIRVDDPHARVLAQGLMTEGVKQLQAHSYDQALANFLAAYGQFPSPKILIDIASTLRDMGRLADAANTYQRYLADPATGSTRIVEVKELLQQLDAQLTILTIRVFPRGSEVSIDGGPFVAVGASLLTRVRPGIHLARVKKGEASSEVTLNGFEGETKEVPIVLQNAVAADEPAKPPPGTPPGSPKTPTVEVKPPPAPPDHVEGWLITGTQYDASNGNANDRRVRVGFSGPEVEPIVPKRERDDGGAIVGHAEPEDHITSGVLAVLRIDGHARGAAGGIGVAYSPMDRVELEGAVLRSDFWGAYLGARGRILLGTFRPYIAAGLPLFVFTDATTNSSKLAVGIRGAVGLEVKINGHLSVEGDLGGEHYFNIGNAIYMRGQTLFKLDSDVFVPSLGLVGRL